ncbi:MAG TPA: RNA polymerase sigma factor [Pyrinomonadaceae bacterium]
MREHTDHEQQSWWILSAQSGSHEALNQLFKSIQEPLFRYIASLVDDRSMAEDILQEVFFRIYRKLKWLKEPAAFRAWTYQIATREVFRHLRRERHWRDQVRDEDKLNLIRAEDNNEVFPTELLQQLPGLVASLPTRSRAVIVLRYLHEMSLAETAAVLGIPLGTVKSRLWYGLEILRRHFKEAGASGLDATVDSH